MSNRTYRKLSWTGILLASATALMAAAPSQAYAIPVLQVYVEGGTYNETTETWDFSSTSGTARVWVIGNTEGGGGKGTISDVNLSVVYDQGTTSPSISLTPSTTGGFGGFTDPSTPTGTGTYLRTVSDGSTPLLADGGSLPSHGEYGAGREWQEFSLGDFSLADSPVADFMSAFPTAGANGAQINVYDISFGSGSGSFHFDAYGSITTERGKEVVLASVFAPFSHDGSVTTTTVPELSGSSASSALALAAAGVTMLVSRRRRHS